MSVKPKIIVSVTNDLATDQRVNRTCHALIAQGFEVVLVGRATANSPQLLERDYSCIRFRLWFNKGPLFYANYNICLFFFILFSNAKALFSNDLDTLPANFIVSKLRGLILVYDSHEYYTGVPELEQRPGVRKVWETIEGWIFPSLNQIITVNESIAGLYEKKYNKKLIVIRNVPSKYNKNGESIDKIALRLKIGLPTDKKILILQGAGINVERGAEEAVEAMQYLNNVQLVILGGGDVMHNLKIRTTQLHLEEKIIFKPRMPYEEMMQYTAACDIGLTLDKDTNLNYRFSLPNKVFDYIQAGIPILASRLPEVEKIIGGYQVGLFIENHNPHHIAEKIKEMLNSEENLVRWQKNLQSASLELAWEVEQKKFPNFINELH
ncbi:MAG: glycosyltransferase [Bacteroidetes bacterium]|nr:glycosyltransferase [Bacteroidota bacterium]